MPHPVLRASGLCFAYDREDVLHGVDVALAAGEVTAIVGPNGSGKSTLVELLAGVAAPREGAVERDGEVAYVAQRARIPPGLALTVREVVAMGTWARRRPRAQVREIVRDALERVDLATLAGRSIHAVSGGQRQRALIAQGIARDAAILLLDEPAAGLDASSRERTRGILRAEARRGRAVGWVTHDVEDVAIADRVIRLEAGRLVPRELSAPSSARGGDR